MDSTNNQTVTPSVTPEPATGEGGLPNPATVATPSVATSTESASVVPTEVSPVDDAALQQMTSAMDSLQAPTEAVRESAPVAIQETTAVPVAQATSETTPVAQAAPVTTPITQTTPAAPVVSTAMPATETLATSPVSPATPNPVAPQAAPTPDLTNPLSASATAFQASVGGMVAATDPITMPSPPEKQDPVEAELEAPIKAADPVPGSIGSAISVPAETEMPTPASAMPNVAFNDPATANAKNSMAQTPAAKTKKPGLFANLKMNKTTLILLCVVAGLVVVALVVVLILQLNG